MVTIKVEQTDKYYDGTGSTEEKLLVTVSAAGKSIELTRDEALYLVSDLGKRLCQLTIDPDAALAQKAVQDAMDSAIEDGRASGT